MSKKTSSRNEMREAEFENEFHRLLGRLVHATARFDVNIGHQLNWLGIYYQVDVKELLNPCRTQLKQRLIALRRIVLKAYKPAGETAMAEFKEWFSRANKARALRNDYVHARWGVPGKYLAEPHCALIDAIPQLTVLPLTWDVSPELPDKSSAMTLEQFAQQVETAESLFADYQRLSKKYEGFAKLGTEGLD
jgi:hypothetical protein